MFTTEITEYTEEKINKYMVKFLIANFSLLCVAKLSVSSVVKNLFAFIFGESFYVFG
jgi:hypothetical protein